ncbi:hypothetical protein CRYUN_Cryun21dG0058100 [Craigia yunnanensis]
MARQIVVLALVLIALVGLVSADNDASALKSSSTAPSSGSQGGAEAVATSGNDDAIGNTDEAGAPTTSTGDEGAAVEGPIGSEDAANSAAPAAQPPTSGATTLGVSAVAGAAVIAGYFVF